MKSLRMWLIGGLAALLAIGIGLKAADFGNVIYSETDASNSASTLFPEGMAPSAVNDNMRGLIGALYRWYNHSQATTASTGSSNAYVLTYAVTPAQYATGDVYTFRANFTNTASASLNVNGLGARTLAVGAGGQALQPNDIPSGGIISVSYDPSRGVFQIISPVASSLRQDGLASTGSSNAYVLTLSLTPVQYATGQRYVFRPNFSNTLSATLNVNGLGARSILMFATGLNPDDIRASTLVEVIYDGISDVFRVMSPTPQAASRFFAYNASNANDVTGNGTTYTVINNIERYDDGGEYNTSNGTFTATVAGRYHFDGEVYVTGLTALMTDGICEITVSNIRLFITYAAFGTADSSGAGNCHVHGDADMDAGDTAVLKETVSGGVANTADLTGHATVARTYFSGHLIR